MRRVLWANLLAYLAVLLLVAGGLYFLDQRDAERQRDICGLIKVTDDAYTATPPQTQAGRNVATAMHAYRLRIGC